MRILPVLDLQQGLVVRGIAGERAAYRPIESTICREPTPHAVALAFGELGLYEAYVADLDAIAGHAPHWSAYASILSAGLSLWVDAGVSSLERARKLADWKCGAEGIDQIVLGLESLPNPGVLREIVAALGPARCVFSLDLKQGQALAQAEWTEAANEGLSRPLHIASLAVAAGVRSMIVLDLASVGVSSGPSTIPLLRNLAARYPQLELISGGGIRHGDDLRLLAAAGASAALVASALHDGRITAHDLADVRSPL